MTVRRAIVGGIGHPVTWLVILVAIFFYKEVFLGRVFSPADQLYDFQPWASVRPPSYQHASNPLRVDESFIFFPRREQVASDLGKFGLSLWDDHNLAGMPTTFSINFIGAFVYPPMWSYLVLPPAVANTVLHLPIPLVAALCMYLLLGRLTRYRPVRLLGAIAWGLNGYMVVWLSAFFLPLTMAILPLLIYLGIRFLEEGKPSLGIAFALLLGASFFLGYQPANLIVLSLLAITFICWLLRQRRTGLKRFLALAGLGALGLGVGALPIITSAVQLAGVVGHRGILPALPLGDLQTYLFPNAYGNPVTGDWRRADGNYCEFVAYLGSIPLILALAGSLAAIRSRDGFRLPLIVGALVTGIASIAVAYAVGPGAWVGRLPLLGDIRPARWQIGVVFAIVVLGTYGLDLLVTRQLPAWTLVASCGLVTITAVSLLFLHRGDLGGPDAFIRQDEILRVAMLAGAIVVLLSFRRLRAQLAPGILCVLLALDLFSFGTGFNPAIKQSDFYPQTRALKYLEAHAGNYRVLVARKAGFLWPGDVLPTYGVDSITGYDHLQDASYVRLLGSNMAPAEVAFWRATGYLTLGQSLELDSTVFNLLGVKYAFYPDASGPDVSAGLEHWHLVYAGADGEILENAEALPRQYIVSNGTPEAIDHVAQTPDHDQLRASGGSTIVWSRPFSPDWHVSIDGTQAGTAAFDGYFLSAQLPAGTHVISLRYQPADWALGGALSVASLVALGLIGVIGRLRRRPA